MSPKEQAAEVVDRLLGPPALAEWLDVPLATVYRWQHLGSGPPAMKVGRHLRWRRADVERWLDAQRSPNRPAA